MRGQTSHNILKPRLQRRLRKNMTDAERRLWRALQRRQLDGFKFRRQHPFGDYIIDFACLEAKLAVEVDGGQHADLRASDTLRTMQLERAGFRVLRFWNNEVLRDTDSVVETILKALHYSPHPHPGLPPDLMPHPHPGLPPEGEGD